MGESDVVCSPSSDPRGLDLGIPPELPRSRDSPGVAQTRRHESIATKELLDDASMEEITSTPPSTNTLVSKQNHDNLDLNMPKNLE
jgi:hypothetical protein